MTHMHTHMHILLVYSDKTKYNKITHSHITNVDTCTNNAVELQYFQEQIYMELQNQ